MKSQAPTNTIQSRRQIEAIRRKLSKLDRALAIAHDVAEPFDWHVRDAGLVGLVRLIIEQQVSTASAEAIWKRFRTGIGKITSQRISAFDVESLREFGLSRQKALYVQTIAEAEASGMLNFRRLREMDDDAAIEQLILLKGVGRWTAEVYLMFCEGRTDLFPAGDLALQEGYRWASQAEHRPSPKELYAHAERWRPHRGVAAHLLWSYYRRVRAGEIPTPVANKKPRRPSSG